MNKWTICGCAYNIVLEQIRSWKKKANVLVVMYVFLVGDKAWYTRLVVIVD